MGSSIPGEALVTSAAQLETVEAGRERMNEVDEALLALLNERVRIALIIDAIKKRDGLPRFDISREHEIIARLTALNTGPLSSEQLDSIFFYLFGITREVQKNPPEGWQSQEI